MRSEMEIRNMYEHMQQMVDRISDLADTQTRTDRPISLETGVKIRNSFALLQGSIPILVWVLDMEAEMLEKYGDIPKGRCTVSDFIANSGLFIDAAYKEMKDNASLTKKRG